MFCAREPPDTDRADLMPIDFTRHAVINEDQSAP
jgi:hypothetical protein